MKRENRENLRGWWKWSGSGSGSKTKRLPQSLPALDSQTWTQIWIAIATTARIASYYIQKTSLPYDMNVSNGASTSKKQEKAQDATAKSPDNADDPFESDGAPSSDEDEHRPHAQPTHQCSFATPEDCQWDFVKKFKAKYRPHFQKLPRMMMLRRDTCLTGLVLCKPLMPLSYFIQEIAEMTRKDRPRNIMVKVGCGQPGHTVNMKFTAVVHIESKQQLQEYGGPDCECSHGCHWGICIGFFHIDLESSADNQGRKPCAKDARQRHKDELTVPKFCSRDDHEPRCKTQLAVDDFLPIVL
ncbi:Uu.00g119850.m01.CDS01 [Anthostomella pinea]|uniref:Uu.00g119850.m01.CDS01 n=1 Tax=Anthostomella pinea TaxID=933095 RepID=A0AAI8YH65_9PEZI|nr:Uu.00g119850.m01.CDS01 [Anthostomella pinea]